MNKIPGLAGSNGLPTKVEPKVQLGAPQAQVVPPKATTDFQMPDVVKVPGRGALGGSNGGGSGAGVGQLLDQLPGLGGVLGGGDVDTSTHNPAVLRIGGLPETAQVHRVVGEERISSTYRYRYEAESKRMRARARGSPPLRVISASVSFCSSLAYLS